MRIGSQYSILLQLLQKACALRVKYAEHEEPVEESVVYIAPPDRHLIIQDGKTLLTTGPRENFTRPAADPLFRSAAVNYGQWVIGVVLAGDLDDGSAGLKAIDACGGFVAVQDPAECAAPGMPTSALRTVQADVVAPVAELASTTVELLSQPPVAKPEKPLNVQRVAAIETRIALTGRSDIGDIESIGTRSVLTCPDCAGVVWRIGDDAPIRYRCHTGTRSRLWRSKRHRDSNLRMLCGLSYEGRRNVCPLQRSKWTRRQTQIMLHFRKRYGIESNDSKRPKMPYNSCCAKRYTTRSLKSFEYVLAMRRYPITDGWTCDIRKPGQKTDAGSI